MKKIILCIFISSLLILSACSSSEPDAASSSCADSDSVTEESSSGTDELSQEEITSSVSEAVEPEENSVSENTAADYSRFTTDPCSYSLFHDQNMAVDLIEAIDYYDQSVFYAIKISNQSNTGAYVSLKNISINDDFTISNTFETVSSGEEVIDILYAENDYPLLSAVTSFSKTRVENFAADLKIQYDDNSLNYKNVSESVTAELSENDLPGFLWTPIKGASASEQVLYEDEECRIRLLGLGNYYSQSQFTTDRMIAFICVENLSENTIPLYFGRCNINNIEADTAIYNTPSSLGPGQRYYCYIKISVPDETESINSVSFQILTDSEENTAEYKNQKGGKLLNVVLDETSAQNGDASEDYIGPLIWEGYDVQIYSMGNKFYSDTSVDWKCRIVNNGTEAISVSLIDELVNNDEADTGFCFVNGDNITPGNSWDGYISADSVENPIKEFSFRFQIKSGGEGSILYNDPNTVTLTYDGPSIEISDDIQYYYNVKYGEDITFTVSADGKDLEYQWFSKDPGSDTGTLLEGETKSELSISSKDNEACALDYYCRIRSSDGAQENTRDFSVIVKKFVFPNSITVKSGEEAVFEVVFYSDEVKENTDIRWFYMYPDEQIGDFDVSERIIEGEQDAVLSFIPTEDQNGLYFIAVLYSKEGDMLGYGGGTLTIEE